MEGLARLLDLKLQKTERKKKMITEKMVLNAVEDTKMGVRIARFISRGEIYSQCFTEPVRRSLSEIGKSNICKEIADYMNILSDEMCNFTNTIAAYYLGEFSSLWEELTKKAAA